LILIIINIIHYIIILYIIFYIILNQTQKVLIGTKFCDFIPISSFFLETIRKNKPEKLPEFSADKIGIVPCNLEAHWFLVLIFYKTDSIVIFDSMGNTIETGNRL